MKFRAYLYSYRLRSVIINGNNQEYVTLTCPAVSMLNKEFVTDAIARESIFVQPTQILRLIKRVRPESDKLGLKKESWNCVDIETRRRVDQRRIRQYGKIAETRPRK